MRLSFALYSYSYRERVTALSEYQKQGERMSNTGTTGRIPLWLVGTVAGLAVITLVGVFFLWGLFWFRIIPLKP